MGGIYTHAEPGCAQKKRPRHTRTPRLSATNLTTKKTLIFALHRSAWPQKRCQACVSRPPSGRGSSLCRATRLGAQLLLLRKMVQSEQHDTTAAVYVDLSVSLSSGTVGFRGFVIFVCLQTVKGTKRSSAEKILLNPLAGATTVS